MPVKIASAREKVATPDVYAKGILRYAGSKRWILPELMPRIISKLAAREGSKLHEPFAGSAAVSFAIAGLLGSNGRAVYLSDACEPIALTYLMLRDRPLEVSNHYFMLRRFHHLEPDTVDKHVAATGYLDLRARFNAMSLSLSSTEDCIRAACFILLNQTCFNGLCRMNADGKFNVPFGERRSDLDVEDFKRMGELLGNVYIWRRDWRASLGMPSVIQPGDVVYCDPPYTGTFDGYSGRKWPSTEDGALAAVLQGIVDAGAHVFLSSADTPAIRALYEDDKNFELISLKPKKGHVVGGHGSRRKSGAELLIMSREK